MEAQQKITMHTFTLLYREVPALQGGGGGLGEKEMMILLQQRKIAALDEANNRLVRSSFC